MPLLRSLARGLLGFACLAAVARSTTFAPATTADLIRRARIVCCARAEKVVARTDARTGIVFTHVRLRLLEDLKGRTGSGTLRLRIAGGHDGDRKTVVAGMPRFRAGEEYVLLLGPANRNGFPVLVGAARGVLRLAKDRDGRRVVRARVTGLRELAGRRRIELDRFRRAVRRLAARPAGGGKTRDAR